MLGRAGGWSFSVSTILISSISKGRKTKSLMHSVGECMNYMLQPLACTEMILKIEFWRLQIQICSTGIG
jgi:hypothetical protein